MTTLMKYSKPQNGMLSLFDRFFDDDIFNWNLDLPLNTIVPNHDIIENDKDYVVDFALAGFGKEDVSLNVENNVLTIEGERKVNEDIKYNRKGTFYGRFRKSFSLPENVNTEKIDASFKNGILSIIIPKDEKVKSTKAIEIK
jgi:HSP20 family protein